MAVNKYGDISYETAGYMQAKMLSIAQSQLIFERFGQVDVMGKNKGKVRTFRRYNPLPEAIAPLAEGVTPAGRKLTWADIEATLEQYGDYMELTDVVQDTHQDPVLNIMADRLSKQIVDTVEKVRFLKLRGGTNVFYANGVSFRGDVAGPATRGDFRKVYRAMKRNRASEISKIISPTPNVGTLPVGAAYFAVGHTDLDADLRGISGFLPIEQYSDPKQAIPFEIGKIENIRICLTTVPEPWLLAGVSGTSNLANGVAPTGSAKADVYPILIFGEEAYAIETLQGKGAVSPKIVQPKPAAGDPIGQRGSAGWSLMTTCVITNELWMARLEVAATANPT